MKETRIEQGVKAVNERNFETSVEVFKEIVAVEPTNAKAWGWLARSLVEANDPVAAEAAINASIELVPKDSSSFLIRGWTRQAQERYEEAIEDYSRFVELDELLEVGDANVFESLGRCYEALGEYEKALKVYELYGTWPYGYQDMPEEDIERVKQKLRI